MKSNFKIHFFCTSPALCLMFEKYFAHTKFTISTMCIKNHEHFSEDSLNITPDCIIIDSEISSELRKKLASFYKESKTIYLPSLSDGEQSPDAGKEIVKVSEPLKISELEKVINNFYMSKISDEN